MTCDSFWIVTDSASLDYPPVAVTPGLKSLRLSPPGTGSGGGRRGMAAHGHGTLTNHVTPSRTLLGRGSHRDRDESRVTIVIIRVTAMIDSPSCDDNCPSPMPGHGHGHRDRSPGRDSARSPGRDSARTRYAMIMASHHHRVRATGTSHQHDGMIMISHQWHDHDHESSWHDLSGLGLSDRHRAPMTHWQPATQRLAPAMMPRTRHQQGGSDGDSISL